MLGNKENVKQGWNDLKTMAKKKSPWVLKSREFECVGIQHRVTPSTRRYLRTRVEGSPILVKFKREPNNAHDPNAIAVYADSDPYAGMQLGYLRRRVAEVLAPHVDSGGLEFGTSVMDSVDVDRGTANLRVKLRIRKGLTIDANGGKLGK